MKPLAEAVQKQILFQHEVLRALLRRLAGVAEQVLRGNGSVRELRDAQRTLHDVLEVHLRQEEEMLTPILRAFLEPEQLARAHENHAKALESLRRQRARPPKQSATASLRLVLDLLARIAEENRDLLRAHGADASPH